MPLYAPEKELVNIVLYRYYVDMVSDVNIWLERLASLHKCQLRKAAVEEGIQLVHLEILHYLSISNKYSNTAQAMSEYLGQSKGSMSQSLKYIEEAGHIERRRCKKDGRMQRIYLTPEGRACYQRMEQSLLPVLPGDEKTVHTLKALLMNWQERNSLKGFGQCKSCQYSQALGGGKFRCDLTGEALLQSDIQKICYEHVFAGNHVVRIENTGQSLPE